MAFDPVTGEIDTAWKHPEVTIVSVRCLVASNGKVFVGGILSATPKGATQRFPPHATENSEWPAPNATSEAWPSTRSRRPIRIYPRAIALHGRGKWCVGMAIVNVFVAPGLRAGRFYGKRRDESTQPRIVAPRPARHGDRALQKRKSCAKR